MSSARQPLLSASAVNDAVRRDVALRGNSSSQARSQTLSNNAPKKSNNLLAPQTHDERVGGMCVEVWNDEHFIRLRRLHHVPEDFLSADIDTKHAAAEAKFGKGGDGLFKSKDKQFILKGITGDDHTSLLNRAEAYVNRMVSEQTMLCPIYMHLRNKADGKCYIALRNLTPHGGWGLKFDLKGCDDDKTLEKEGKMIVPVRKRWYMPLRWFGTCMWTEARNRYFKGKVRARALEWSFPPSQQSEITHVIQSDAEWLSKQGLMDYSLYFCTKRYPISMVPALSSASAGYGHALDASPVRRLAYREGDEFVILVTMGIIDFLQPWTAPKKVAQCIKMCESNKATIPPSRYGARFGKHFAQRFKIDSTLQACTQEEAAEVAKFIAQAAESTD